MAHHAHYISVSSSQRPHSLSASILLGPSAPPTPGATVAHQVKSPPVHRTRGDLEGESKPMTKGKNMRYSVYTEQCSRELAEDEALQPAVAWMNGLRGGDRSSIMPPLDSLPEILSEEEEASLRTSETPALSPSTSSESYNLNPTSPFVGAGGYPPTTSPSSSSLSSAASKLFHPTRWGRSTVPRSQDVAEDLSLDWQLVARADEVARDPLWAIEVGAAPTETGEGNCGVVVVPHPTVKTRRRLVKTSGAPASAARIAKGSSAGRGREKAGSGAGPG